MSTRIQTAVPVLKARASPPGAVPRPLHRPKAPQRGEAASYSALAQLIGTVGTLPPLGGIKVPVAVLPGGTTLADTEVNRQEVARFPNNEVITLRANHWPLIEAPDETREAIEGWIEETFESPGDWLRHTS